MPCGLGIRHRHRVGMELGSRRIHLQTPCALRVWGWRAVNGLCCREPVRPFVWTTLRKGASSLFFLSVNPSTVHYSVYTTAKYPCIACHAPATSTPTHPPRRKGPSILSHEYSRVLRCGRRNSTCAAKFHAHGPCRFGISLGKYGPHRTLYRVFRSSALLIAETMCSGCRRSSPGTLAR